MTAPVRSGLAAHSEWVLDGGVGERHGDAALIEELQLRDLYDVCDVYGMYDMYDMHDMHGL